MQPATATATAQLLLDLQRMLRPQRLSLGNGQSPVWKKRCVLREMSYWASLHERELRHCASVQQDHWNRVPSCRVPRYRQRLLPVQRIGLLHDDADGLQLRRRDQRRVLLPSLDDH